MSLSVQATRIELLALSDLTAGHTYDRDQVSTAIAHMIDVYAGVHEAVAAAAGEYGDHPEAFAVRIVWARTVITAVYPAVPCRRRRNTISRARTTTAVGV